MDPQSEQRVQKIHVLALGFLPKSIQHFPGIRLLLAIIQALEQDQHEPASPIVIRLVNLFEQLIDSLDNFREVLLPVLPEHKPDDPIETGGGIEDQKPIFDFVGISTSSPFGVLPLAHRLVTSRN